MTEVLNISKVDIASAQLERAIQLYVDKTDLISAVTLAGAAEEILGKLVSDSGEKNAFEEVLNTLCAMHAAAFQEEPNRKAYAELRNGVRNQFKHLCAGESLTVNLDSEAAKLINRAIANYRKLFPGDYPRFRDFAILRGSGWSDMLKERLPSNRAFESGPPSAAAQRES